ncbi:hypothetical protein Leryth_005543 [Lithospermum erythrorhizon]|nr:hypothetical protein Leryth_005543 [Lithospermum erythrorhizon]
MHSFGYRINALLTFSVTILALMCAIASFSDNFNSPSPSSEVQVMKINWFQKSLMEMTRLALTLNISAKLCSPYLLE